MNEERIEEGDFVNVYFANNDRILPAEVLYIPVATGDSWILQPIDDRKVVYVQLFERMELFRKGKS